MPCTLRGGTDTTTSGTVPAGSFTANWDGTTASGDRATQGTYTVCIESAVEHGSESLIRQQVTFGASSATTALTAAQVAWDVIQLQASRSQPILDMHRMAAQNPVWIVTACKE